MRVGLGGIDGRPVRAYSLGMRQRLGIAAALLRKPELLLLDEPTNGLDPRGIGEMRALLRHFAAQGTTVLLSSHLLSEVEALCTRVGVMSAGRLVLTTDLDDPARPDRPGAGAHARPGRGGRGARRAGRAPRRRPGHGARRRPGRAERPAGRGRGRGARADGGAAHAGAGRAGADGPERGPGGRRSRGGTAGHGCGSGSSRGRPTDRAVEPSAERGRAGCCCAAVGCGCAGRCCARCRRRSRSCSPSPRSCRRRGRVRSSCPRCCRRAAVPGGRAGAGAADLPADHGGGGGRRHDRGRGGHRHPALPAGPAGRAAAAAGRPSSSRWRCSCCSRWCS